MQPDAITATSMRRIHSQLSSQAPSGTSQRKDIKPTQVLGVRQEGGIERKRLCEEGSILPTATYTALYMLLCF